MSRTCPAHRGHVSPCTAVLSMCSSACMLKPTVPPVPELYMLHAQQRRIRFLLMTERSQLASSFQQKTRCLSSIKWVCNLSSSVSQGKLPSSHPHGFLDSRSLCQVKSQFRKLLSQRRTLTCACEGPMRALEHQENTATDHQSYFQFQFQFAVRPSVGRSKSSHLHQSHLDQQCRCFPTVDNVPSPKK